LSSLCVAICGAGPTGLASAILLKRAGHNLVVAERFEAAAAVGSGLMLQPTGLAVLAAMGLEGEMRAHGRAISHMGGRTASGRLVLDVGYDALAPGLCALAVHRSALFGVLLQAAQREGVAIEPGFEVVALKRGSDHRPCLVSASGAKLGPFDLVIDAAGARSPLAGLCGPVRRRELAFGALWATLPWPGVPFAPDRLEQRYRRADQMAGVLPVGRRHGEMGEVATFFWSLRPADYPAWRAGGLDAWKRDVLDLWPQTAPLLDAITSPDDLTLARYGHHTLARPFAERLVVIGDAAHATSPQLGQGANMGLLDALALARALEAHGDIAKALAAYARARRLHVRLYQTLSLAFTPFYQSDSRILPAVRDLMLAPTVRVPGVPRLLAAMVSGLLADPRPGLGLPSRLA
jgi:2-polyprenyl-6-methoxyphenol hydroxylase-like FAD-dependent oxidoreductase